MIYRPFAGERIWDEFIRDDAIIEVTDNINLDENIFNRIMELSQNFAYDIFLGLKENYEKKQEEDYRKYSYALELRIDAAKRIGIENIRRSRLRELEKEKEEIKRKFEKNKIICPVFKPIFILRLE